jgi:drug/metabolite transporter (DMT)-like permease
MTTAVFGIILFAAALHAIWNAIVKDGDDRLMTTVLVTGAAALIAVTALPFLPAPARASWLFIAVSAIVHIGYFALIARTYRAADMSQAYPLMRGAAPVLVAVASVVFLRAPLTPLAWLGIAVTCAGILAMAAGRQRGPGAGFALANAGVIAAYTLIDGIGVRRSGAPPAYALWIFLLAGAPLAAWGVASRRRAFRRYVARNWRPGMVGGVGTVVSYGLALWAMTIAPIAIVSALRETSILFGAAISGFVLKEKLSPARIAGACVIAAGAVVLRLT